MALNQTSINFQLKLYTDRVVTLFKALEALPDDTLDPAANSAVDARREAIFNKLELLLSQLMVLER